MSDPTRNPDKIDVGDTAEVVLIYHQNENPVFFTGIVLYTPCGTGDSWHFRDIGNGGLRYVQTFADMRLIKKAE